MPDDKKPEEKPPERRPVLYWHAKLGTKRDLLCLAATMCGWDPRQEEGSIDETEVSQAEYEAAIVSASVLFTDLRSRAARPKNVLLFAHPTQLIAVVVRKPTAPEAEALSRALADDELSAEETQAKFTDDFAQRCLWPKEGTEERANLMEEQPVAFHRVFPAMVLESAGADTLKWRKRG